MKKVFQIAAWVIVIGVILVWWLHTGNDKSKTASTEKAKAIQAKEESTRKAIIKLADKHNAVVNWSEPISKKSFMTPIFTIEVEDALLRKDNRPVLFLATVKDVERKENKYLVRFIADDFEELSMIVIECILDCSDDQTKIITQQNIGFWEQYAVIAEIQKVRKVMFNLKADNDNGEPEIRVDATNEVFVATGKCLDLLFIEE